MAHKRMTIKISEELYKFINAEAEREGLSMNAVIIFALNNYKQQNTIVPNISLLKEMYEHMEREKLQQKID